MNNKTIGLLAIAILAMALIVVLKQRGGTGPIDEAIGTPLFPGLKEKLSDVNEVRFRAGNEMTTIARRDDVWVVVQKDDYPASFSKLSGFLGSLAEAKYAERKTARPENFDALGVTGIDNDSSKATWVSVHTNDGSTYETLIGNEAGGRKGRYVRKPEEDQVWLVDKITAATGDPVKWIEPVVLSIDSDQVSQVTHRSADGGTLTVKRAGDEGEFEVENLPAGAELKYGTIADTLAMELVNVRATDVRARGEEPWQGVATATFDLKDGSQVVVHGLAGDDGHWLRFDLTPSKEPSEAVSFVDTARIEGWEFKVADYTFDQFTRTMDDMIKAKDEKKAAG